MTDPTTALHLGFEREIQNPEPLTLPTGTLLRHMMALGSSGSGKTVLCKVVVEEICRQGLPAICIDPQGDLCSLALRSDEPEALIDKGIDPDLARAFSDNVEVVIFTPASRRGVAICADPLNTDPTQLKGNDRIQSISSVASMLVSLLGYALNSDDGEGLVAVFDRALTDMANAGRFPRSLQDLTDYFGGLGESEVEAYGAFIDPSKLNAARRKMSRLEVGARRLLFHEGLPLNMDLLLGRGDFAPADPNRTRLSVIYLNSLNSAEDKEFFIAAIVEQLYGWMLKNPSKETQALFYIDEVAPFLPPVRKPACKPGLQLLFKQARKYGIGCLMATQNPGDVDYKAMAQFGTWALGRLTTRQDLKKVFPTVKSLDPVHADAVMEELPALTAGQFLLISPDAFAGTRKLQCRWLYTQHETLDESRIESLCDDRWREVFDDLESRVKNRGSAPEPSHQPEPDAEVLGAEAEVLATETEEAVDAFADIPEDEEPAVEEAIDPTLLRYTQALGRKASMNAAEFADRIGTTDGKGRTLLKKLVEHGLAREYKEGRSKRYYSTRSGVRPDLGFASKVQAIAPKVTEIQAEALGREHQGAKKLGFIGQDEKFISARLAYKVLLQLRFTEKVETGFFKRMFGPKTEERKDAVYLHPRTMQFVLYSPNKAVQLTDKPGEEASRVADFDGVTTIEQVAPGFVDFDETDWVNRIPDDRIKKEFKSRFNARPGAIKPILLPVWKLEMEVVDKAQSRVVTVDGLSGKLLDW